MEDVAAPVEGGAEIAGADHGPTHGKKLKIVVAVFIVLLAASALWYFRDRELVAPQRYEEVYQLVRDKVSQSAAIVINLPGGTNIAPTEAKNKITFIPEIAGDWLPGETPTQLTFQPKEKLTLGKYYEVTFKTEEAQISKDFLIDEDPEISAIFPNSDSEAPENSNITVVFNRPMVPLTSLSELEAQEIPLEVSPKTAGRFKWITTRNLQFIPEERLFRSTNYSVTVKPGFVSMDGLSVPAKTHSFRTRVLRYENLSSGQILYNDPVRIVFNQPVNLERTKGEISVKKGSEDVGVSVRYGTRRSYNQATKRYEEKTDEAILEIYNERDRQGRHDLWDFGASYALAIEKAYPVEGDIILNEKRQTSVTIPNVIKSVGAESERSKYVSPYFFDPRGKMRVTFFEDIDKDASTISAPNIKTIEYGERCKKDEDGNIVYRRSECEKETDYAAILVSFDHEKIGLGEEIPVTFKKIVNREGLRLNVEEIGSTPLVTYPKLAIMKTVPATGAKEADLTKLVICTTSPLEIATEENFSNRIWASYPIGRWNWFSPFLVTPESYNPTCRVGEFQNTINYGLVPEVTYELKLNVIDDFGQQASEELTFLSGKIEQVARKFHHLQKQYNITTPQRTKLTYGVENLEYVDMNICKIAPETLLDYMLEWPGSTDAPETLRCQTTSQHRIDLPKRFWAVNYFQVDLKEYLTNPLGHYVVTFSHPEYRRTTSKWNSQKKEYAYEYGEQIFERTYVTITNLAAHEKKVNWQDALTYYDKGDPNPEVTRAALSGPQNLYWVTYADTLAAVPAALIDTYEGEQPSRNQPKTLRKIGTYFTAANGIAATSADKNIIGAIVKSGADSTVVSELTDRLQYGANARSAIRTYLYTDRPIYRPGQKVHIKGLHRVGYDANYIVPDRKEVKVEVFDSRGSSVFSGNVPFSEFGTFTADFILDTEAPLGTYRINALEGYGYFDVEKFVPAPFKVEVAADKEEYISKDTATLKVAANYFFGLPVEGGEVEYSIVAQDYFFDRYRDGSFDFTDGGYYRNGYGDKFLLRGKAQMNQDGEAIISQKLDFDELFKEEEGARSKIFVLNVTAKNINGQSVSAQKSFIVHRGEFYIGLSLDSYFLTKDKPFSLKAKTVDAEGKNFTVGNVDLTVNKITWEYFKRREVDGGFYYRYEEKREQVKKLSIRTDSSGDYSGTITLGEEGQYEIEARATDKRGNAVRTTRNVYVSGPGYVRVRPTNNETLDLATDKAELAVGEKGSFIIQSPYPRAKALISFERGKVFDYEVIDVNGGLAKYEFTVKEDYIPNVYATVLLVSPDPEIKFGQINYRIDTKEKEIKIQARSDKNHYLPGEKVTLDISAEDSKGRPLEAEVSVAVVDLSVLALKGNPKKDPLIFFYSGMPLAVTTASNVKNILHEAEIPVGTKGGGGGEPEDLARKKRGDFRETALWEGTVFTDKQGRATLSFTLPDNLTAWQIEALGITRDTKLGVGYGEFISKKDLMVLPLRPRFVVPGDEFSVGAKIINDSGKTQSLTVSFESASLEVVNKKTSESLRIGNGETKIVYFSLKAPANIQDGSHVFTVSAKNDDYEDTVEQSIPITRNNTFEAVATAWSTNKTSAKELIYLPENIVKDRGGATIKVSATLSTYLSDALNYLVQYPYGCSEQIASKLSSVAIVKRGLSIENVGDKFSLKSVTFEGNEYSLDDVIKIGLARIYENQTPQGGFTYYRGMESNFYLTLHIVNTLKDIESAGYEINKTVLDKAARYLSQEIKRNAKIFQNKDTVILAAYTLTRVHGDLTGENAELKSRVIAAASDDKYINEQISSMTLANLALLFSEGSYPPGLKEKAFKQLENRVDVDSRGAFVKSSANRIWDFYETPIKNTALLLKAYAADKRDSELTPNLMRWLIKSRGKDGAWGSTQNTVAVIDGFTDFLKWKGETRSEFRLSLLLDKNPLETFSFNKDTILDTFSRFISMSDVPLGKFSAVEFSKENLNDETNTFYYDISLKYFLPIEVIPPRDEGFSITRELYHKNDEEGKNPVREAKLGDVLRGHLTITVPKPRRLVAIEDFIPAGMEIVNLRLATEDQSLRARAPSPYYGGDGYYDDYYDGGRNNISNEVRPRTLYPNAEESHDDRLFLFAENLSPGVYEFDYFMRALVPGKFHHLPATVSEMYFPENFGRTAGNLFKITE
ncbi:MAG: MG2 domain-containing protein [bacterium]|nr:MG2 domain-containing protein [bacterium]